MGLNDKETTPYLYFRSNAKCMLEAHRVLPHDPSHHNDLPMCQAIAT